MAAGHIQVAPNSTGSDVDGQFLTSTEAGNPSVMRQTITLGDATTYGNLGKIDNLGRLSVYDPDIIAGGSVVGSLNAAATVTVNSLNLVSFGILTSNLVGTIIFEGTVDLTNWVSLNVNNSIGISQGTTAINPVVGAVYRVNAAGYQQIRARCSVYTSGTTTIASVGSDSSAMSDPIASGTNNLGKITLATPAAGINATITGYGNLRVSDEESQIFYDPFDSALDTTNRWSSTVTGTGASVTFSAGSEVISGGTAASAYAFMNSLMTFIPVIPGWLQNSYALKLESGTYITTCHRFWGMGTAPGTPTAALPLTDAVGFEIDTTGALNAVVYANGTRTIISALTSQLDGNYHRYIVQVRTDKCYFYIDSLDVPVATSNFQSPSVQTLPIRIQSVTGTGVPSANPTITCTGVALADTAHNNHTLSDGTFGWRKATVKPASTAALATDTALVTGFHPSSPLPTGNNFIGKTDPDIITTGGVIGALNAAVTISNNSMGIIAFQFLSTSLVGTISFEGTIDGTNWIAHNAVQPGTGIIASSWTSPALGAAYRINATGFQSIRIRVSAYTSGTATVTAVQSDPQGLIALNDPLPTGTNTIGNVNADNYPGTFVIGSATSVAQTLGTGYSTVGVQVLSTTLVGTLIFEATIDGTNWFAINAVLPGSGLFVSTVTSPAVGYEFRLNVAGYRQIRIRCSSYTSGTSTWQWVDSMGHALVALAESLPTGANVIGGVTTEINPSISGIATAPLFAVVNVATGASNAIVAANATKTIRVLSYVLVSVGTVNVTWQNGSTALSGAMPLVANSGASANAPAGLFATSVNTALNLLSSAAIQVSGHISYILV